MSEHKTEAEVVSKLAREGGAKPHTLKITDGALEREVLLVPTVSSSGGQTFAVLSVKDKLAEYQDAPDRRTGTATMTDLPSFIAHVNRFSDIDSAVFVDRSPTSPSLTAVLDYHRQTHAGAPRFGKHRTRYAFPLSEAWKAWKKQNGEAMSQGDLAVFLEDRIQDIADPANAGTHARDFASRLGVTLAPASRLLELSKGLEIHVGQRVVNKVSIASGEASISFEESHKDGSYGPLKIPSAFVIGVPCFQLGEVYEIPVRLRYRVKDGAITWSYELSRVDEVFEHAVNEAVERVRVETTLPVMSGAPES